MGLWLTFRMFGVCEGVCMRCMLWVSVIAVGELLEIMMIINVVGVDDDDYTKIMINAIILIMIMIDDYNMQ